MTEDDHSHHQHTSGGRSHGHAHHAHGPTSFDRQFVVGIALNVGIVVLQVGAGLVAQSLALISDAVHNLSDVLSLMLAFGASLLARRRPSGRYTYGLRKASIIAALINAGLLLAAIGAIVVEALQRVWQPTPVASGLVMVAAAVAVLANGATAALFARGHEDLNIKGAYLHMLADAAVSVGVLLSAALIAITGWLWLDPAVSVAIAGVLLWTSWGLIRGTVTMALDAVPERIELATVRAFLEAQPGVIGLHDLHVWSMSTTEVALTAHLVRPEGAFDDSELARIASLLHDRFGIDHPTLQVEQGDPAAPCKLAPRAEAYGQAAVRY